MPNVAPCYRVTYCFWDIGLRYFDWHWCQTLLCLAAWPCLLAFGTWSCLLRLAFGEDGTYLPSLNTANFGVEISQRV